MLAYLFLDQDMSHDDVVYTTAWTNPAKGYTEFISGYLSFILSFGIGINLTRKNSIRKISNPENIQPGKHSTWKTFNPENIQPGKHSTRKTFYPENIQPER